MAKQLRGVFTALVTPFNKDGSIDMGALDALVDAQIAGAVDGFVPCGTTGEAATLSAEERVSVINRVAKRATGRPVIAGTGTNDTRESIEHHKRAQGAGATHALVVTPYYNKPTPEGLFRHYEAIARSADLPIVVYNVPGRTGVDMKPETVNRIAALPHVIGVKEATADLDRVALIRRGTRKDFALLSGDDGTTLPFVLLGGDGVISVASNVVPKDFSAMVHAGLRGALDEARTLHEKMRDLFVALFWESNPIPVKAGLVMQGIVKENFRLPLCEMSPEPRKKLESVLRAGGWIGGAR
jgi:4-hydroxy-tetrahydrodipicolinate synthase